MILNMAVYSGERSYIEPNMTVCSGKRPYIEPNRAVLLREGALDAIKYNIFLVIPVVFCKIEKNLYLIYKMLNSLNIWIASSMTDGQGWS